jgi:hypothetical protein
MIALSGFVLPMLLLAAQKGAPAPSEAADAAAEAVPARAQLTIFRHNVSNGNALYGHKITIDGRVLGKIYIENVYVVELTPGEHTICTLLDVCLQLTMQAGVSYYLEDNTHVVYGNQNFEVTYSLIQWSEQQAQGRYAGYIHRTPRRRFVAP